MASRPQPAAVCTAPAPPGTPPGKERADRPSLPASRRWPLVLAAVVLLHLTNPLTWGRPWPGLWFPPAGVGLALIAWFGPRWALVVLADGLLVLLQTWLLGTAGGAGATAAALLTAAVPPLAWWLYHHRAHGARGLGDPRSAILFVFLVPGLSAGLFAVAGALLMRLAGDVPPVPLWPGARGDDFGQLLGLLWLDQAMGLLVVAPPLLVNGTSWLRRRGLAVDEEVAGTPGAAALRGAAEPEPLRRGDWIEVGGLAAAASILSLLLALLHNRRELAGWQLWGIPLLLTVWASVRQGLRGGTLVAGAGAAAALLAFPRPVFDPPFALLLQVNLLAQCSTALLVAAASGWVRANEARYRQAVSHIPVVVYSARFRGTPGCAAAEVTLVSAASSAVLGCPPEHLLGDFDQWLGRVHPDDREILRAAVAQLGRQDQPFTCEYRLDPDCGLPMAADPLSRLPRFQKEDSATRQSGIRHPPSAMVRWVRDTIAPHRDTDGRLAGWDGVVTDITEQRVLSGDLRRTTSMFHTLVANLPAGVFFVQGPHGRPILVNARARQLLGQREDAAAGLEHLTQVYRLFRPDGTPFPVEELPVYQALRRGATAMRDDIVVHRPDGRRVPLVSWAAPVRLTDGTSDAAVWVLEDRTALQQAEAARLDSEGRLRAVVETMGEGLIVQDRQGRIGECNPTACALLGRSAERLRGQTLADLDWDFVREDGSPLPAEDRPAQTVLRLGRPVRNVILGLVAKAGVTVAPAPTTGLSSAIFRGPVRWLLANAMPLAPGRAPAGVVTTFSDVSAHVYAQQLVRASEEKYRGLVEALPLMLLQYDRDLRLTYANPAWRTITGHDPAAIAAPAAWGTLLHPDDLPRLQALVRDVLTGMSGRLEFRYRAKDGSEKVAFALLQPAYEGSEVVGVMALLVDVTRERQLEHELQRAQRLELIGRLSSGIAHDFNNLLSVVLTLTQLAQGHLPDDHPARADLQRVTEAGQQAGRLAAQLLAFSRPRRAAVGRVEVNPVVRRTLDLLRGTLQKTIAVESGLAEQALFVQADETQLQQVLMNLCLNARDAMPQGGRLRVETALGREKGWVRLSVDDEGEGMSEQVREQIFEPFFSTKEQGTGLGLAVVQQIVESYGGRIEVRSAPGRGARFEVWWPAAE